MTDPGRGPEPRSALSRCIGVSRSTFAGEHWGAAPLLSPAARLDGDFADLFSLGAVDELIANRALRTPFVRMAKEGSVLPAARFTAPGGYGAEVGDQLSGDKVLEEFAAGSTIVLQGLHRTWEPLSAFTRELSAELGTPCQVNAYVTPAASRGFDPHYDVHDVFVIQIHGRKRWSIHSPVHTDPLGDEPWTDHRDAVAVRAAGTATIDETLAPGDVLYLPRGWIHSATALGDTSIHLTVGIAPLTRHDIVLRLVEHASGDARLRASLPLGIDVSDAGALAGLVRETIDDLADRLSAPDRADPAGAEAPADGVTRDEAPGGRAGRLYYVSRELGRRRAALTRPQPIRPLATVEAAGDLHPDTLLAWRGGLSPRTIRTDTAIAIVSPTRTISLPVEAAPAIDALAAGTPLAAGRLPGLDDASSLLVGRRLLREGILVVR